jgi:hypothetical protein
MGAAPVEGQQAGLVSVNPVTTIGSTHQSKRRKRVLSDAEQTNLDHAMGVDEMLAPQTGQDRYASAWPPPAVVGYPSVLIESRPS